MRILFLSSWFPYPPTHGSKLRIYHLLRGFASAHEVTLLTFVQGDDERVVPHALLKICKDVRVVRRPEFNPVRGKALLGFVHPSPRSVVDTFSREMAALIEHTLAEESYDIVVASELMMAAYRPYFADVPAIFEEVETAVLFEGFSEEASRWRRSRHWLTWVKHRRYMKRLLNQFDAATVVSEAERSLLATEIAPGCPVKVIPNCVDLSSYSTVQAEPQRDHLIFTGAFTYNPNYEAMAWFLSEVLPRVHAERPSVKVTVTGDHADMHLPYTKGVTLTGFVDDIRPLVASSWISLAPIWQGGGTRLKILEAMALGTPVVATSKGAEGLDVCHGQHLLLADTAPDFANAVVRLCEDETLRSHLAANARRLVSQRYDWRVVLPSLISLVTEVADNADRKRERDEGTDAGTKTAPLSA